MRPSAVRRSLLVAALAPSVAGLSVARLGLPGLADMPTVQQAGVRNHDVALASESSAGRR